MERKKTEREHDNVTQYEFIKLFPVNVRVTIDDIGDATGCNYSNTRARCNRYAKNGYIDKVIIDGAAKNGRQLPFYFLSSAKRQEMIDRIHSHGSLSPRAKELKTPQIPHLKNRPNYDNLEIERLYNLMVGIGAGND